MKKNYKNVNVPGFEKILKDISSRLDVAILGVKRLKGTHNSTKNIFLIEVSSKSFGDNLYFLKFSRDKNIEMELRGTKFVSGSIKTPKIVLSSQDTTSADEKWILFEYVPGLLMGNIILQVSGKKDLQSFLDMERVKEKSIKKLHAKKTTKISYDNYIRVAANKLFYNRFFGQRFKDFYSSHDKNISLFFDRRVYINEKKFPLTIGGIIDNIRDKYRKAKSKKVDVIMGHGDAHHGNILFNEDVCFIDNEYAGYVTPFMELAKPYYNDLLGSLFFHNNDILHKCFRLIKFRDDGKNMYFTIRSTQKINPRLEITKIKLKERKETVGKNTEDYLSLKDYLLLCHLLTKDPNEYSSDTQKLFLAFCIILSSFDPFKPETICRYF